jgi:hypothetical protein
VPDYSPVFLPGLTMTSVAAGAITGGDPVEVAGSGTVQKCTAGPSGLGSARYVGVALMDTAPGLQLTVVIDRVVHQGNADGAITAGDQLMASAKAGCQVRTVPATATVPGKTDVDQARVIIGLALTSAPDGIPVRWMQT